MKSSGKRILFLNYVKKTQSQFDGSCGSLKNNPKFRLGGKGNYLHENIYYALGKTDANRYLFVVFILKRNNEALILSAREMDNKEKSIYSKI